VYTRNGPGYVHDNIAASVEALRRVAARHGIGVAVSDTPSVFTEENLSRYAAVVFSNSNNEAFGNDAQRLAFMRYIRAGGGFAGIHSACASERGWPWFWALVGGRFVRHPAHQPFDIRVVDPKHPAADFLPPVWKWRDECYFLNHLNPDIRVLLAADLGTLADPERAAYPGETFGNLFPLAWTHEFEGSRQFYTALGHDIAHYSDPLFERHLERGLLWVLDSGRGLDWGRAGSPAVELAAPEDIK
jgi:type 1 glutamine amidotransferase